MAIDVEAARSFFGTCEVGKGWDACRACCTPNATSAAQSEALAEVRTLQQYTD